MQKTVKMLRCVRCSKLLAEKVTPPYQIRCVRCGYPNSDKIPPAEAAKDAPKKDD